MTLARLESRECRKASSHYPRTDPTQSDGIQPLPALSGNRVTPRALRNNPSSKFKRALDMKCRHAAVTFSCFKSL